MSRSGYYDARNREFITGLSMKVRKRIYDRFAARFGQVRSILDVGVTSERSSPEANFLEKMFPHKERITAVGIEDASFLETEYPGLKFRRIEPDRPLPFADRSFDVAFSHAVIEHIVDPVKRAFFVQELLRVSSSAFITTPNKFFPVEPHTGMPFLHFVWPDLFYWLCDRGISSKFYNSTNLRLLARSELLELVNGRPRTTAEIERVRLFGFTSNWILTVVQR